MQGIRMSTGFVLLGLCAHGALAQGNSASLAPALPAVDACRAEVSRFEQAIGFVRQNQGAKAAADLKEKLLPARVENELLMKDGYCGLARYLQEKKLTR